MNFVWVFFVLRWVGAFDTVFEDFSLDGSESYYSACETSEFESCLSNESKQSSRSVNSVERQSELRAEIVDELLYGESRASQQFRHRFTLESVLSHGLQSTQMTAYSHKNNRTVLIKLTTFIPSIHNKRKCTMEVRIMLLLRRARIPKVTGYGFFHTHSFIVMDYITRNASYTTLGDALARQGHPNMNIALNILGQIVYVVAYMHSLGITHNDINDQVKFHVTI